MTEVDVLVIGAGILGSASAYYIKKNSPTKSVLLVDRCSDVAQGNTARSNAMFRNTFTSYDNRILTDTSIDFYLELERQGNVIDLRRTGYLWLMSEGQLSKSQIHIEGMKKSGIEIRSIDRAQLSESLPQLRLEFSKADEEAQVMELKDIIEGAFGPKCGRLDPWKLSRFYFTQFQRLGGEFVSDTSVDSLLLEPDNKLGIEGEPFVWQDAKISGVRTSGRFNGEIRAENVILCAGAWMNELLEPIGLDGHVKAKKRQLFTISSHDNVALRNLIYNASFNELNVLPFVILPKSSCFVKAIPETNEFWVGCDDDINRSYFDVPIRNLEDYKPEPEYYANNVYRILKEYFPDFNGARPRQMWAGLYSYNTLDYLPFVFRDESTGIITVGGDSGSGIMKGDSLGRIADAVYRDKDEAELYGGRYYRASKLGFKSRDVEREEWVL